MLALVDVRMTLSVKAGCGIFVLSNQWLQEVITISKCSLNNTPTCSYTVFFCFLHTTCQIEMLKWVWTHLLTVLTCTVWKCYRPSNSNQACSGLVKGHPQVEWCQQPPGGLVSRHKYLVPSDLLHSGWLYQQHKQPCFTDLLLFQSTSDHSCFDHTFTYVPVFMQAARHQNRVWVSRQRRLR